MKYITFNNLIETIRKNLWKIPRDIDFIIGVPRSGMIVASIISDYLNVPLMDLNSFLAGLEPTGGDRLIFFKNNHNKSNKVLLVEDTVWSGRSLNRAKQKCMQNNKELSFICMCAYFEGPGRSELVDIYLEDLRKYTHNFSQNVIYEWNIFHHYNGFMLKCLYDIDGVFCLDPPDERNEEEYLNYIKNATPLFIPTNKIGGIMSYRLIKNKEITEKWLHDNGIRYNELIMFDANTWEERHRKGIPPGKWKGEYYKQNSKYNLFVESNDNQAKTIFEISGKPVYCVETNKVYQ